jgi:hypothetical protein
MEQSSLNHKNQSKQTLKSVDKVENLKVNIDHIKDELVNYTRWKNSFNKRKYISGQYRNPRTVCKKPMVIRMISSLFPDNYRIEIEDIVDPNGAITGYKAILFNENNQPKYKMEPDALKTIFFDLLMHYEDDREFYFQKIYGSKYIDIDHALDNHINGTTINPEVVNKKEQLLEIIKEGSIKILESTEKCNDKIMQIASQTENKMYQLMNTLIDDHNQLKN